VSCEQWWVPVSLFFLSSSVKKNKVIGRWNRQRGFVFFSSGFQFDSFRVACQVLKDSKHIQQKLSRLLYHLCLIYLMRLS
jgi:hypothetical protein